MKLMIRVLTALGATAVLFVAALSPALAAPSVSIQAPKEGETVSGPDITVRLKVSDLRINPDAIGKTKKEGEGHVHVNLDGNEVPIGATSHTFTSVVSGSHTLRASLHNNDHSPLDPAVAETINFSVGTVDSAPAPDTATSLPLALALGLGLLATGGVVYLTQRRRWA